MIITRVPKFHDLKKDFRQTFDTTWIHFICIWVSGAHNVILTELISVSISHIAKNLEKVLNHLLTDSL